jgi:hypothetical protein
VWVVGRPHDVAQAGAVALGDAGEVLMKVAYLAYQ